MTKVKLGTEPLPTKDEAKSIAVFPAGTALVWGTNADTKEPMVVLVYKNNMAAFPYGIILEAAEAVCQEIEKDYNIAQHLKATKEIN